MSKKNISGAINKFFTEAPQVHEEQHTHDVHNTHDVQTSSKLQGTQGRKGQKLPRINMAFSNENMDYLRTMASATQTNVTAYVNMLVNQDRERNKERYEQAIMFFKK